MRKPAAIAVLAGALLLAGCSATPVIDREAVYLKLVHDNTTNTASKAQLITMAHATCDALGSGSTLRDVSMVVATSDLNAHQRDDVSKIIGYGISQYCPELGKP